MATAACGSGNIHTVTNDTELSIGSVSPATLWISTRKVGVAPSTPTVLALIGRDVLAHCTIFYNGPRSELTLSY